MAQQSQPWAGRALTSLSSPGHEGGVRHRATVPPRWDPAPSSFLTAVRGRSLLALMDGFKRSEAAMLGLHGFASHWVETSVGTVRLLEAGKQGLGPAWIFLHGFASQATDWAPLLRRLRRHCGRIIALDLPGHGRSPVPLTGLNAEMLLRAGEQAILSRLAWDEPCVLVGNSMGGLGAVRLAQKVPKRVLAQVLLSPAGAPMSQSEMDTLMSVFELHTLRDALRFVDRLFINGCRTRFLTACGAWAHLNRPHLRSLLATYRQYPSLTAKELRALPQTLFIWGEGDSFFPPSSRDFFLKSLPVDTTVVHMPERFSHSPYLDAGAEVTALLVNWAKQHGPHLLKG